MLGHSLQQLNVIFIFSNLLFSSTSRAMEPKESPLIHAAVRAIQFGYINELEYELTKGANPDETLSSGMPLLCMLGH